MLIEPLLEDRKPVLYEALWESMDLKNEDRRAAIDILIDMGPSHPPALIPKDSRTDGASIPRLLWRIWPADRGKYSRPAWLHDYRYRTQKLTRKEADKEFAHCMRVHEVDECTIFIFYWTLRLGGWKAWNKNKANVLKRPNNS